MDVVFFFLAIAALILVWRWLAKRLHSEPWIIRHIAGATAGFVALALIFGLGSGLGFYELEQKGAAETVAEAEQVIPVETLYRVIKDDDGGISRRVEIVLSQRVNEAELEEIAARIKSAERRRYENTHIGYRLESQPADSAYWASTHYMPELEVIIRGLSARQYDHFKNLPLTEQFPGLIGSWIVDSGFRHLKILHVKDGKLYLEENHPDNSQGRTETAYDVNPDGSVKFFQPDHYENQSNDYFTLDEAGTLKAWNDERNYAQWPSRDGAVDISLVTKVKDIADWARYVPPPSSEEVAAIASKYTSLFTEYLSMGVGLERVRGEPMCMDKMRTYKPLFKRVSDDFSKAIQSLPANKRFNDAFEPLYSAQVDLSWCLNCTNTAMASCISAAKALDVEL